jgi:sec-independent protein translocase protein TatB
MINFGLDELMLIGAVALIVIGPQKLPRVARTVGHFVGKAQRYVADVKAEVNRSIELDELKKMKTQFEQAARDVEHSVADPLREAQQSLDQTWGEATAGLDGESPPSLLPPAASTLRQPPRKNWRLKRGAVPKWYKQRHGVRTRVQSAAARVARFRPPGSRG